MPAGRAGAEVVQAGPPVTVDLRGGQPPMGKDDRAPQLGGTTVTSCKATIPTRSSAAQTRSEGCLPVQMKYEEVGLLLIVTEIIV